MVGLAYRKPASTKCTCQPIGRFEGANGINRRQCSTWIREVATGVSTEGETLRPKRAICLEVSWLMANVTNILLLFAISSEMTKSSALIAFGVFVRH